MARTRIRTGSTFEQLAGYSRAVIDGPWVWVAGTTGFDYSDMSISPDVAEQTDQTFRNIAAALEEAGSSLDDVVRVVYYLADAGDFERVAPILGTYLGTAAPAATAVQTGFIDDRILIEIEVTARKQEG